MKLIKTFSEIVILMAAMQWAYLLAVFGYEKWGFFGGFLGLISSPALLPFSPFTAWLFFPRTQLYIFYTMIALYLTCIAASALLRPRVVSDYRGH